MIGNILIRLILTVGKIISFSIIVDAILSWVPEYNDTIYKIRQVLQKITYPIMGPVRKLMSPITYRIMIDLSPIVAIFALEIIQSLLIVIVGVLF